MRIQNQLLLINIIGGISVLGGYVIALMNHPKNRNELWGGVPEELKPWITSFMFVSALGYCIAMYYLIFQDGLKLNFMRGNFDHRFILTLVVIFLVSASMWIHTTFIYLGSPSKLVWRYVQAELWITGLSIFLIMISVITANGVKNHALHLASIIGLGAITFHCLFLDALLWISKFPLKH